MQLSSLIRCARLLAASLLTITMVTGLSVGLKSGRVIDRTIRGARIGQRLEFGQGCPTRLNDHRHVSCAEQRPDEDASVMSAAAGPDTRGTRSHQAASVILTTVSDLRDDALVERLAPPGGLHRPHLRSPAPLTGRAPPFVF